MKKITFITGPAGTGKSHRLRQLLAEEERPHLICAPTGIAAIGVGGSTIHRTFKIDSHSGLVRGRWPQVEVVYVDEVSMMGKELFEYLTVGAPNADFVFVGDMAQLPPVKDKFWFESPLLAEYDINFIRLETNYRQATDDTLFKVLSAIRKGDCPKGYMKWLYSHSTLEEENEQATVIAYRNDTVGVINAERLLGLTTPLETVLAEYEGIMKPTDCKAEAVLNLKVGAEVIFTVNDPEDAFRNGTRGIIKRVYHDRLDVNLSDSFDFIEVKKHKWLAKVPSVLTDSRRNELTSELNSRHTLMDRAVEIQHALSTGIEYVVAGSCTQFPLKLAYAMTVHKSQGTTLNNVKIIMSGFAGTHGIGYVALSRATSIDSITFDRCPRLTDFRFNPKLAEWI